MRPIRTERTNFMLIGDGDQVGDLPAESTSTGDGTPCVVCVYELDEQEREAIAAGANVALAVFTLPTSFAPVALGLSELTEVAAPEPEPRAAEDSRC